MTVLVALAFGAELWPEDEPGYAEWRKRSQETSRSWAPWKRADRRRKLDSLSETRMRLTDERRRRAEAEDSLSKVRTRMAEMAANEAALQATMQELEAQLAEKTQALFDLRLASARAEAASPERVRTFLDLADEAQRGARFDTALELLNEVDGMLGVVPADRRARLIVRLEFLRSTSLVAMDDEKGAASSLSRLLDADPDFRLDASQSSPKLLRVLDRLLAERSPFAEAPAGSTAATTGAARAAASDTPRES